jgi:hypothetical protein
MLPKGRTSDGILLVGIVMAQKLPFRRGIKHGDSTAETELIAVCCVCGLIRVSKKLGEASELWLTTRAYEQRYGVPILGSLLTHTYCSGCYTDFMQRVGPSLHTTTSPLN